MQLDRNWITVLAVGSVGPSMSCFFQIAILHHHESSALLIVDSKCISTLWLEQASVKAGSREGSMLEARVDPNN